MRRYRRWWIVAAVIIVCYSAVSAASFFITREAAGGGPPPGWQTIRPPKDVRALAQQGDLVWAGGAGGVVALDVRSGEPVRELAGDDAPRDVMALLVDSAGRLWVGHGHGLTVYEAGKPAVTYTEAEGLPSHWVSSLLEDDRGRIWAGTGEGVAILDGGDVQVLDTGDGLLSNEVFSLLQDTSGGVWIGSKEAPRGGLSHLQDGRWQYFTTETGLPHNDVCALLEDDAGVVWAGTGFYDRGGLARLVRDDAGTWTLASVYGTDQGMPGAKIRSLLQADDGAYWIGTEYNGVARMNNVGSGGRAFSVKQGLAGREVKVMLEDTYGALWLGSENGVTRVAPSALAALRSGRAE
jgi:ligand-binding sensor domain-containing protein